ncbi:MAG: phosphate propanoyltransferase [Erysipelothrix sp.]|nr:phosphate propanoyltransferase [Erysipelothrix sp.]
MNNKVLVEISARHVHLTDEHLEVLFGEGHQLHNLKELSQPGQYATEERVTLKGPKGEMSRVIVLGPTRPATQVEISATDARALGVKADVRMSGDIANTGGMTLVGPAGSIELNEGVIVAKRHIHLSDEDAKQFELEDQEVVNVKIETEQRSLIFDDVVVRVNPNFRAAMHIDTDEGNAAGIAGSTQGIIIKK